MVSMENTNIKEKDDYKRTNNIFLCIYNDIL